MLSYTFQRLVRHSKTESLKSTRHHWIYSRKEVLIGLTFFYFTACVILFFLLFSFKELLCFSPLIIVSLFYAVKMSNSKALRDISFVKIVLISLSWTVVSVLIPAYVNEAIFLKEVGYLFALNFTYIFALVIPFDIRDIPFDEPQKKTIPQLLGVDSAKYLSLFLIGACGIGSFFFTEWYVYLFPIYLLSVIFILLVNKHRKELFYVGAIDGLILLFPVSTWIVKFALW